MLRAPSSRKRKKTVKNLNLIPILDSVFIFIFFLLMSANFIEFYEIQSNVPIVSNSTPPPKKKPLALMVQVLPSTIKVFRGVSPRLIKTIGKLPSGEYDLEKLHDLLVGIKQRYRTEKSIMIEPLTNVTYQVLVEIMDAVREFRTTDPAIFIKDKNNMDKRQNELFPDIVFTNIQS